MPFDELLLQSILNQSQSTSDKLDKISNEMVIADDFRRFQNTLDEKFVDINETLEDFTNKFTNQDKLNINHESRIVGVQSFISNISSGFKWFMRALIVAGLTLSTSIFVGFFNEKVSKPVVVAPPIIVPNIPMASSSPFGNSH